VRRPAFLRPLYGFVASLGRVERDDLTPRGAVSRAARLHHPGRTAALTLATLVAAAFAGYGLLSTFVDAPRVFGDEIIYMDAADSLADGHGLSVQGRHYGRGPGYPAVVAPIFVATQQRSTAYFWTKLLNAFAFALTAVPIYFLARRLLPRRPSALVAALSLAIPSSIYIGLVMTDSLAYLLATGALLAIALALERPTVPRQIATFACIGLACLVRSQFAVLLPAYLLALAAVAASRRDRRRWDELRRLWPTAALALAAVVVAAGVLVTRGSSVLGDYAFVVRSYDAAGVARWSGYHLADLALYLGLVPMALLPCILLAVHRSAAAGARARAAFLALFAASNLAALLVAGAFSSTPFSQSRVYDRYVFYVVPLWLIAAAVWLREGAPRPAKAAVLGTMLLLAAVVVFPFDTYVVDDASKQLHAAGTPIWARLGTWAVGHGQTGHRMIAVVAIAAVTLALLVPRRAAWTLVLPVVAVFAANSVMLWRHGIDDRNQHVFASRNDPERHWIDDRVPGDQTVAMVDVLGPHCNSRLAYAYALTEFFNDRVDLEARLRLLGYGDIPSTRVRVGRSGKLVRPSGRALRARWVVVPDGVELDGSRVADGTRQHLVLWRTDGAVTVDARSNRQLENRACTRA
jgi:hypothetical protein